MADESPPCRLLKGTCSLIFEGQSFIPAGGKGKEYWLELPGDTRNRLMELLLALGWQHELQPFEAEFYGSLRWIGHGCGHLGMFGGIANVEEVVAVHFTPTNPRKATDPPLGIRGLIRRSRPPVRGHYDG